MRNAYWTDGNRISAELRSWEILMEFQGKNPSSLPNTKPLLAFMWVRVIDPLFKLIQRCLLNNEIRLKTITDFETLSSNLTVDFFSEIWFSLSIKWLPDLSNHVISSRSTMSLPRRSEGGSVSSNKSDEHRDRSFSSKLDTLTSTLSRRKKHQRDQGN